MLQRGKYYCNAEFAQADVTVGEQIIAAIVTGLQSSKLARANSKYLFILSCYIFYTLTPTLNYFLVL